MESNVTLKQQDINNALMNESERSNTTQSRDIKTSTFDKSFQQATSFNAGLAVPVLLQEVYPGDTYEIDANALIRLSAPSNTPFMSVNYDLSLFFVPFEQIDKEFHQLMGENNEYGFSDTNIKFPKLVINDNRFMFTENDLGNYFNIPINTPMHDIKNNISEELNLYPFLAYGKIWNEHYRDQNLQGSINITTWNNVNRRIYSTDYEPSMSFYESIIFGKGLAPTSKLPSYYTTNLPYQQKGNTINLGSYKLDELYVTNKNFDFATSFIPSYRYSDGKAITTSAGSHVVLNKDGVTEVYTGVAGGDYLGNPNLNLGIKAIGNPSPYNINDLRESIVAQHLLENFALCGSRYVEQLKSIWGIEVDPKTIGRTEIIGGYNDTLQYGNIPQTSQTTKDSPLGALSSNLYNSVDLPHFEYSSGQHGYIMGIVTCRTTINNGGQGLPKLFSYDNYLDLFNPMFNGIGEQPTKNKELFYSSDLMENEKTFGFNEPFINTKYNIDNANGFMSLKSKTSLFPMFLFGEAYSDASKPKLSDEWIRYNPNIIGNTLFQVNDVNIEFYHQFVSLISYKIIYTTEQPLFNSPRVYGI
nr:MAG: major capsid protein [Microvirus Sku218]